MTQWTNAGWASRCTEATVANLTERLPETVPITWGGVLECLTADGKTYTQLLDWCPRYDDRKGRDVYRTLRSFVDAHPEGCYYLCTAGHAMALVDGLLVDTADRGPDGRYLLGAYRVAPKA